MLPAPGRGEHGGEAAVGRVEQHLVVRYESVRHESPGHEPVRHESVPCEGVSGEAVRDEPGESRGVPGRPGVTEQGAQAEHGVDH